jgi:outer membrane protein assembly factor BamB
MLGGLQTGCAFDGQKAFTNGIDWPGVVKGSASGRWFLYPPSAGRVTAIRPNGLAEFWRHERPQLQVQRLDQPTQSMTAGDPVGAGIALANGVAFFTTTISNKLVAVDCSSGQLLFERELEPLWTGPAVSRGRVFVGTGSILWQPDVPEPAATYVFNFPIHPNGAVYCLGLPGADEFDRLPEMEVATTQ